MNPSEPISAERVAENRRSIAALTGTERSLAGQLRTDERRIDEQRVERFGAMLRAQLLAGDATTRRAYVRLLVSDVTVNDNEVIIAGLKAVLEHAAQRSKTAGLAAVPVLTGNGAQGGRK